MSVMTPTSCAAQWQTTEECLIGGGDDRLRLDARGLNAYGCRPKPAAMTAYSSSTASTISAAAFHAVRAIHYVLAERLRAGEPAAMLYAEGLERLRHRLRGVYGLADESVDIAFTPSGTDLELVVLALALAAGAPVTNILVGEDEVGSGCVLSARGLHFRTETARAASVAKGERIAGFDPEACGFASIDVRQASGQARPRADIVGDIRAAVDAALTAERRAIVHVVHRSKTGIVVPTMSEVETLRRDYGGRIDITVDACQGRISPDNLRRYLAMDASVMVTGSKFIGGPPFSGFAFVPASLSQRLQAATAPFPSGLGAYFDRSEMPASWAAADAALQHDEPSFGLLLRLEAAVFELQRLSMLPPAAVLAVVDAFGEAIRTFTETSARFDLFIAAEGLRPESHIEHPFERDMLFTLKVNGTPRVTLEQARTLYHALYENGLSQFLDGADRVAAAEEIHVGQPVRCLRDADGTMLGTLRLSISAPLISDLAGLDAEAKLTRFAADFARIERKVDLLLSERGAVTARALQPAAVA
jgi:selenocysteine lyase/cysteine desulfurase